MGIIESMKRRLSKRNNYGNHRNTSSIRYIVIHYTANDGDTDEANANYFATGIRKASAHYFVDDDSITQSVLDDYNAWSVGGSRWSNYKQTGGARLYKKCTNANSISIELCDTQKDGVIYPTQATIQNALELTRYLMSKYNVPLDRVIRHFDVTGKACPAYWVDNNKWKKEFHDLITVGNATTVDNAPKPTAPINQKKENELLVDGIWGVATTKRLQEIFGTTVDGKISNQNINLKDKNPGLSTSSWCFETKKKNGSQLIRKIQQKLGITVDGRCGEQTIKAMQKWLGTTADGKVSRPSQMVKALQRWCNNQ